MAIMSRVMTASAATGFGEGFSGLALADFGALGEAAGLATLDGEALDLAAGFVAVAGAFLAAGAAVFLALAGLEVALAALAGGLLVFAGMDRILETALRDLQNISSKNSRPV